MPPSVTINHVEPIVIEDPFKGDFFMEHARAEFPFVAILEDDPDGQTDEAFGNTAEEAIANWYRINRS